MLEAGAGLVRERGISSDVDLGPLIDPAMPFDGDPQLRQRFQHMYEAGAWVLLESAIADLPADLRWLFESGAVTIAQLAAIYQQLGATSAAELGAAVARRAIRSDSRARRGDRGRRRRGAAVAAREDSQNPARPCRRDRRSHPRAAAAATRTSNGRRRRARSGADRTRSAIWIFSQPRKIRPARSTICRVCPRPAACSTSASAACTCCSNACSSACDFRVRQKPAPRCFA